MFMNLIESTESFIKFLIYSQWAIIGILVFLLVVMAFSFSSVKEMLTISQKKIEALKADNEEIKRDIESISNLVWGEKKGNVKYLE